MATFSFSSHPKKETEWDYSDRKGRDGQNKKNDKGNKKRKK